MSFTFKGQTCTLENLVGTILQTDICHSRKSQQTWNTRKKYNCPLCSRNLMCICPDDNTELLEVQEFYDYHLIVKFSYDTT